MNEVNKKPVELANEAFETRLAAGGKPKIAEVEKEFGLSKNQLVNYRANVGRLKRGSRDEGRETRARGSELDSRPSGAAASPLDSTLADGELVWFPVGRVRMTGNSRTIFERAELDSLKASMRETRGAMQPVVGYRVEAADCDVELLMGERRLRVTQELNEEGVEGYDRIRVILRAAPSRREWLTWNLMENLQRSNLRPSEVGARYELMLAERDEVTGRPLFSQKSAAEETGVDANFVADCLALQRVPPAVRRAVDEGRCALETAALIGTLPKSLHEQAAGEMVHRVQGPMTREQAREWVASRYRRDLRKADFDEHTRGLEGKTDEVRVSLPACVDCEWWGGNRDDVGGKLASTVCLDPRCFEAKQGAMLERELGAEGARMRMLSGTERRKVIDPATGGISPDCGYVELARKPDGFFLSGGESAQGNAPTWGKALEGTEVATVVVFDESGRKRVLVETPVAMEGVMQGRHAAVFSVEAAGKFESREERTTRKRIAAAREGATAQARRESLAAFARMLRLAIQPDLMAATVRLAMGLLMQGEDEGFLRDVLTDVFGGSRGEGGGAASRDEEEGELDGGIAAWLESGAAMDDLWMALILVMQARRVRLEGLESWTVVGSPMETICEVAGWAPEEAMKRAKALADAAEKRERAAMAAEEAARAAEAVSGKR